MCPVPDTGKHVTCANGGKVCNRCRAGKNSRPVASVEKHLTCSKFKKTCGACQVEKTCNWLYTQENMQPASSAQSKTWHRKCAVRYSVPLFTLLSSFGGTECRLNFLLNWYKSPVVYVI